jgi:hypothetical protein
MYLEEKKVEAIAMNLEKEKIQCLEQAINMEKENM